MQPLLIPAVLAAQSPSEAFKHLPKQMWINIAICIVAVIVIIRLWRGLKNFNEFAPYLVALLAMTLVFFYWVYERAEPAFLTPIVDKIAPFFPSGAK